MKTSVSDEMVAEYARRVRAGTPLGKVFPGPMSDCAFTPSQREVIRQARHDRKLSHKAAEARPVNGSVLKSSTKTLDRVTTASPAPTKPKAISKLAKMLYLQSGRCFFCGEPLQEEDASIEHLNPKSRGGASIEENEVVCHRSLNETFGGMDLKRKFAFVLKSAGSFKCP